MRNKIAIVLSLIVSVIAIGYVGTAVFYSTHFFSKTVINGIDCSNKNVKQVEEYLEKEAAGASFEELEMLTLGGLRKAVVDGDVKTGSVMSGQIAGMVKKEQTCKEMIEEMMGQAEKLLGRC